MSSCTTEHFCSLTQVFGSLEWRLCSPIMCIAHHKNYAVFADDTLFFISTLDRSVAEAVDVDYYVRVLCNPTGISKGKGAFVKAI